MADEPHNPAAARVHPAALAVHDAARLLSKASGEAITEAMLAADIASGAPTNPNGTLNLIHYAAWLVMKTREDTIG